MEPERAHERKVSFKAEVTLEDPNSPYFDSSPLVPPADDCLEPLLPSTLELVIQVFNEIDSDHSRTIDLQETLAFYQHNFAKVNAKAMFDSVDTNRDGRISLDEWVNFWQTLRRHSHLDEEIVEELGNIQSGSSWVVFHDMPAVRGD
jgi:hypothetical protein